MSVRATMSGLLIAVIGFVLTRFTVTLAATDSTGQFLFAGVVPLVLGLSLSAFGVILAVGAHDPAFVRTTAVWCVLGTVSMVVLVVLTLLGSEATAMMDVAAIRERTYLSNFLIGGAIGGTLTGLYAAQNRRQRTALQQQANRLVLLNRLLRDEVINAATAIKGYTQVLDEEGSEESAQIIEDQADSVIETVENVKYLSETADRTEQTLTDLELGTVLSSEIEGLRERHPDVAVSFRQSEQPLAVRANARLGDLFAQLLENAAEYSEGPSPEITVELTGTSRRAVVRITDEGPGLPESQRRLLEEGEIAEFDDPTTGFGLNIVRLLAESFDGSLETTVTEYGSTVEVSLPRAGGKHGVAASESLTMPGVSPEGILHGIGASLLAGVTMAVAMLSLGGDVPVIGALYGADSIAVAVIAHEFHSVVFGLLYVAHLSALPASVSRSGRNRILVGVGFGVMLWLVAAGLIMPLWLQFLGLEASVPNLGHVGFAAHVVWGITLGALFHSCDRWLPMTDVGAREWLGGIVPRL